MSVVKTKEEKNITTENNDYMIKMKRFYSVIRELVKGIDDIYDRESSISFDPYYIYELKKVLIDEGIKTIDIEDYIEEKLVISGLNELRPQLKNEISNSIIHSYSL